MPVIKREAKPDLNQVSVTRINEISEAEKNNATAIKAAEPAQPKVAQPEKTVAPAAPATPAPVQKTKPTTEDIEKVAINLKIPKYKKDEWKVFFVSHGLTITDGIDAAVSYLMQQVENGSISLGAISINKN